MISWRGWELSMCRLLLLRLPPRPSQQQEQLLPWIDHGCSTLETQERAVIAIVTVKWSDPVLKVYPVPAEILERSIDIDAWQDETEIFHNLLFYQTDTQTL